MATKNAGKKKAAAKSAEQTTETATPTATPAPAPAAERPKLPTPNGVTRPSPETAPGTVWTITDQLGAEQGKFPTRADVMAAGKAQGLNEATIATQYGRYRKYLGLGKAAPAATTAAATEDAAQPETADETASQAVEEAEDEEVEEVEEDEEIDEDEDEE